MHAYTGVSPVSSMGLHAPRGSATSSSQPRPWNARSAAAAAGGLRRVYGGQSGQFPLGLAAPVAKQRRPTRQEARRCFRCGQRGSLRKDGGALVCGAGVRVREGAMRGRETGVEGRVGGGEELGCGALWPDLCACLWAGMRGSHSGGRLWSVACLWWGCQVVSIGESQAPGLGSF